MATARRTVRNALLVGHTESWSSLILPQHVAETVRAIGVAELPVRLPRELIDDVARCALPTGMLRNVHDARPPILRVATNEAFVATARAYLGTEPRIVETNLWWTGGQHHDRADAGCFHYDVGDVRHITFFAYLTDVLDEPGAHAVIEGTHQKSLSDLWHHRVRDDAARARYGDRIRVMTGPAGTAWFESVFALHRRMAGGPPRLLLNVLYGIGRRPRPA